MGQVMTAHLCPESCCTDMRSSGPGMAVRPRLPPGPTTVTHSDAGSLSGTVVKCVRFSVCM